MKNYDILIIGGGLIGASTALALAPLNLSIGIIESRSVAEKSDPGFDGRAIVLAPASQRFFANLNLWSMLSPHTTEIKKIHVSEAGRFGATRMEHEGLGYVIEAHQFQRCLIDACAQFSNIHFIAPATLEKISHEENGILCEIRQGETIQKSQCRLLIGSDGNTSRVREWLGIEAINWDYQQTAIIANIALSRSHHHIAYERFSTLGPMGLLPMSGDRSALVWALDREKAEEFLALDDQKFLKLVQQHFGYRLGRFQQIGRRQFYPLSLVRSKKLIAERAVLLGNAAQNLHPIAGQGFNLGLRDIAHLQDVIAKALQNQQDFASTEVLHSYSEGRFWDQTRIITFSDSLNRLFTNPLRIISIMREAGILMMEHLPPLKSSLMHYTMGLGGKLPPLLLENS